MKTQTRRFIAALVCAAAVITASLFPASIQAQGVINISSQAGLGPVNPTTGFVSDVTYALLHGLNSYGSWQSVPNGSVMHVTNIFSSTTGGGAIYHTLAVTSSVPFTLAGIYSSQWSPLFSFSGTMGDDGATYSLLGIGIGSDGTVYTSGNANTPVNAVYLIGYGYSIDITGQTLSQALNAWGPLTPFTEHVSYTVNGSSVEGFATFVTSVPEPSTTALCALGGIGLFALIRRRKI